MIQLPFSLSYSKVNEFYQCQTKFWANYRDKLIQFVDTKDTLNGKAKHAALEVFGKTGYADMTILEPHELILVQKIREADAIKGYEGSFGFTSNDFGEVHDINKMWDKMPNGEDYYFKGQYDCFCVTGSTAVIIDHKWGKRKKDQDKATSMVLSVPAVEMNVLNGWFQLDIYAIYIFLKYPEVQKVKGIFAWHKENTKTEKIYFRKDLEEMRGIASWTCLQIHLSYQDHMNKDPRPQFEDNWYNPTPLCGWCGYKDRCVKAFKKKKE